MWLFLSRRIGLLIVGMLLASMILFTITQLMPGDVGAERLGRSAKEEAVLELRRELGLDRPLRVQYLPGVG